MPGAIERVTQTQWPGGVQAQVGDLFAGERRRVVFALCIPQLAMLGVTRVAEVVLRYVSVVGAVAAHEVTMPVTVNLVSADEAAAAEVDHEVTEQVVLLSAAKARRDAAEAADRENFAVARTVLHASASALRDASSGSAEPLALIAEADALDRHIEAFETDAYTSTARKRIMSEAWRRGRGRQP